MVEPARIRYHQIMSTMSAEPVRVAVVEDDDHLRDALTGLIEGASGFRCVATYANAEDALRELLEKKPQVVLMDINLPGLSGIECIRQLKARSPVTQFLVLTVYEETERVFDALKAGATGYLLKRAVDEELFDALLDILRGGAPMTSLIARKVVESFRPAKPSTADRERLTPREREIVEALAKGLMYKEIADQLGISLSTVRTHIKSTYEKLQVQNRTQATLKVIGRE